MTDSLFIDGTWKKGSGAEFSSIAPATGETLWTGTMAGPDDVAAAIAAARAAFKPWARKSVDERLAVINAFVEELKEHKEEIAAAIAHETGKPLWDARTEAGAMIGKAAISVQAYEERTGTKTGEAAGATMRLAHRPHGVMAVIGPFNFPGHLPNGHIIPALLAGNTVVFKPSELTPMVAEKTLQRWEAAGLPAGVINLVQGGREVAEQLIADERVAGILFTGGIHAGRAIHKALAGQPDKILALELGGNNPLIAWDVEDKQAAARIILRSAYITSGQRCTCARRLIVEDSPEGEALISALDSLLGKVRVGAPDAEPEPFMGPLVSARAADGVIHAQEELIAGGARAVRLATITDQGPAFVSPGLIDVTEVKTRKDEEIFGPVLQVIRVRTFEEALAEANDTRFGLAAGLISDSHALFERFIHEINAGIVNWNRQTTGASGAAPFGGPGLSGNHRPAGYYAADYAAWPMASLIAEGKVTDDAVTPGIDD
ncbi:succinylglutamate-semialdehyde dehydrogenase [Aquisalinus flavus]|uniref:N-succinylglutamate 5-semialdehyde dehydrogenase n=1 Tax=Aquisalinus flavus TaxID=1526572 RepID=A0A8J2Y5B0_9PROT|nr:succinylglutamate-semialdehyde dehydrogenase [Aquisalinus flavus]MBD0426070.1 succinylglutamate-semialdehyde dehydrogenase [Aquisalinus flavus]UNE48345.1 succinylglutamate-semialdehyde dehydrogenase [Aquisalinus flavus]GGD10933.1 N-succinylglutamate 5-semialdehyde dehydrogenase [Aquisalinus flavus]